MSVLALPVTLERRDVLRCLGYPRSRQPSPRVDERLTELWGLATEWIQARGCFVVVPAKEAAALGIPARGPWVGLGVCTIGPRLETESDRCMQADKPLDALLLDACGSSAAEAAADALNQRLCQEASALGSHTRPRFSPGYRGWDMGWQGPLLARLGASDLGITCSEGQMMTPRKSVSFAVRMQPGPPGPDRAKRGCARCSLLDCAFRDRSHRQEAP